jgi:flagellin-like hook-associated protein FlgL
MALNDISLTAGMRSNLLSLQSTTTLLDRTQSRLATGKKVNTALDNPTNFFAAQNHTQRASDLTARKDAMSEAIQGVTAADKGITGITALIEAARGLSQSARSSDATGRDNLAQQFNTIRTQIDQLASDSGYKGKNFLKSDTLNVLFNENGGSSLTITGFSGTSAGLTITALTAATADAVALAAQTAGTSVSTAITATHTGYLDTTASAGTIATGQYFASGQSVISGTAAGTSGVGVTVNIGGAAASALSGATGTTFTGLSTSAGVSGYTINAVYANGTLLTSGTHYALLSGAVTGTMQVWLTGTAVLGLNANLATGNNVAITFDITVQSHMSGADTKPAANLVVYNMATGDIGSGANLASLSGGIRVAVSGSYVAASNYTISGNQIIFNTGAVPSTTTGAVTYSYNTGYSAVTGPNATSTNNFTGIALAAGQAISGVLVNAVAATTGYSVSGNQIVFNTGLAAGAVVTYSVITCGTASSWVTDAGIDSSVNQLDAGLAILRTQSAALASNLNVVATRQDFTNGMITTLLKGADNLTLADMNEEGANMLMLQTRQQLSTTSLKMASDAAQAVLRLF